MGTNSEILNFFNNLNTKCLKATKKNFVKGETITTYIEKRNQMCILLEGSADLIRYDYNGNKSIIFHFVKGDIFGEAFYPSKTNNELFVLAKENCRILTFIHNNILTQCKDNCSIHNELYKNLQLLIINNVVKLNTKLELLSKKNLREKLLAYFDSLSKKDLNKTFYVPFSYTDLADYLNVDRSAMMREISRLENEGFIEKSGKRITLLY